MWRAPGGFCVETRNKCFGRPVYEDLESGDLAVIINVPSGEVLVNLDTFLESHRFFRESRGARMTAKYRGYRREREPLSPETLQEMMKFLADAPAYCATWKENGNYYAAKKPKTAASSSCEIWRWYQSDR